MTFPLSLFLTYLVYLKTSDILSIVFNFMSLGIVVMMKFLV